MKHDEAITLVAELAQDRLDEERRSAVESHMNGCEECRAASETYHLLSAVSLGEANGEAHPDPQGLVSYALRLPEEDTQERQRIGEHLARCPECVREVALTQQAEAELASNDRSLDSPASLPGASRRSVLWVGIAAGFVLVMLLGGVYWRYLALRQATEWSGPVAPAVLTGVRLGERVERQTVTVAPGQPYVVLRVDPVLPRGFGDPATFRFEIRTVEQRVVWQATRIASDLEPLMDLDSGLVTWMIPAGALPTGDYEFVVTREHAGQTERLLRVPLSVERG